MQNRSHVQLYHRVRVAALTGLMGFITCATTLPAAAQSDCAIDAFDPGNAYQPFQNPPEPNSSNDPAVVRVDLTVKYSQFTIAGCDTRLRSYNGSLVGPTVRIKPGQTLESTLTNDLPDNNKLERLTSEQTSLLQSMNTSTNNLWMGMAGDEGEWTPQNVSTLAYEVFGSHGGGMSTKEGYIAPPEELTKGMQMNVINEINTDQFNITNLHTHGWHVDPTGISDNVFRAWGPGGVVKPVRVKLPVDHVAGTGWYHAHHHGSTALQVSSGMAGALIVEDFEKGLESLPAIRKAKDLIWILQQVAYDENGEIENYDHLGGGSYDNLKRPLLVNGQVYPVISVMPGEVQRWRFIHAGLAKPISPKVVAGDLSGTTASTAVQMYEIALDGIPTGTLLDVEEVQLYPGYRVDVLIKVSAQAQPGDELAVVGASTRDGLLAKLKVIAGIPDASELPTAAQVQAVQEGYPQFKDITDAEISGQSSQIVQFNLTGNGSSSFPHRCPIEGGKCEACEIAQGDGGVNCDPCPEGFTCGQQFMYGDGSNFFTFNPSEQFVRTLTLGTANEWEISSRQGSHPFHIHVNPFQFERTIILRIVNEADCVAANGQWDAMDSECDFVSKVWKDTLVGVSSFDSPPTKLRSRYTRFTGAFVMHCHILNHEDQGMMQVVEIEPGS